MSISLPNPATLNERVEFLIGSCSYITHLTLGLVPDKQSVVADGCPSTV